MDADGMFNSDVILESPIKAWTVISGIPAYNDAILYIIFILVYCLVIIKGGSAQIFRLEADISCKSNANNEQSNFIEVNDHVDKFIYFCVNNLLRLRTRSRLIFYDMDYISALISMSFYTRIV